VRTDTRVERCGCYVRDGLGEKPSKSALPMYTIFQGPADYPGMFVLRKFLILPAKIYPAEILCIGDSLDVVREHVPYGAYNLGRMPEDDPTVVETWV